LFLQVFLTAHPQDPFRHADRRAKLCDEKRSIQVFVAKPAKSMYDL